MNWPTMLGSATRRAWGSTTLAKAWGIDMPRERAASSWPRGTAARPERTASAR